MLRNTESLTTDSDTAAGFVDSDGNLRLLLKSAVFFTQCLRPSSAAGGRVRSNTKHVASLATGLIIKLRNL